MTESEIIEIPELLNKNYFKKSLENGLKVLNVKIHDLNITLGSSAGENYSSQIYRARIKYSHHDANSRDVSSKNVKNISLIIKYMEFCGEKQFLEEMQVYENETKIYLEVIPAMEKLLGGNISLAPKCLYTTKEPVSTLVFQDMCELGYKVADRINGLNEDFIIILLEKIAKFHATSLVLAEKNPDLIKSFSQSMFHSKDSAIMNAIFVGNLDYISDLIKKKWPNYDTIAAKIRNIKNRFCEIVLKIIKIKHNTIAVLNHADLWVNNMMFKTNDNNIATDVVLIDMQVPFYASLGVDLNYFLNTSVPTEILKTKRYDLLRFYFGHLTDTLNNLNHKKIPNWEEFKNEIRYTEFYGFYAYEGILPIICMDREASKHNSIDVFVDEEQLQKQREIVFNSERMLKMTKYSLDRFDELQVFDQ